MCGGTNVLAVVPDLLNIPNIKIVQLPPCHVENQESWQLLDEDSKVVTKEYEKRRRDHLLSYFKEFQPHVVILEMFPFGRRRMHFEVEPLLDCCYEQAPRPAVLCSIRDVLVASKDKHHDWAADKINTYFDAVLIHGDPTVIEFDRTFTARKHIIKEMIYTGYVVDRRRLDLALNLPKTTVAGSDGTGEVIVSAGGGHSGNPDDMFRTILSARACLPVHSPLRKAPWRVLVGWCNSDVQFTSWQSELVAFADQQAETAEVGSENWGPVIVERARSDFLTLLERCTLSISQGGYNTVTEFVAAGWGHKCVLLPIHTPKDDEQVVRARELQRLGLIRMLDADFTAQQLAAIITTVSPSDPQVSIDLTGASTTASHVLRWGRTFQTHNPNPSLKSRDYQPLTIAQTCLTGSANLNYLQKQEKKQSNDEKNPISQPPLSKKSTITFILLNYKRPENLRRILASIEAQTMWTEGRVEIFLWNNSGLVFTDPRITWQVNSSQNRFCWPRWFMGSLARTTYICSLDDDNKVLSDLVQVMDTLEVGQICGFAGTVLHPDPEHPQRYGKGFQLNASKFPWQNAERLEWQDIDYLDEEKAQQAASTFSKRSSDLKKSYSYIAPWSKNRKKLKPQAEAGTPAEVKQKEKKKGEHGSEGMEKGRREAALLRVDVVKGRMMCMHTVALQRLNLLFGHDSIRGDDIAVCGMLARGQRHFHRLSRVLAFRMSELPAPHALCKDEGHYIRREQVCKQFFRPV